MSGGWILMATGYCHLAKHPREAPPGICMNHDIVVRLDVADQKSCYCKERASVDQHTLLSYNDNVRRRAVGAGVMQ